MQAALTASYQKFRRAAAGGLLAVVLMAGATLASAAPAASTQPPAKPSAVAAMRDAVARQQWQRLPELALAAVAEEDPLLIYAEYWLVRAQFELPDLALPARAAQAFIARHPGTYLADRLRGDWILAAARRGDFAAVRKLGDVQVGNAAIRCAQLHARYDALAKKAKQAGRSFAKDIAASDLLAVDVIAAFAPNDACWALIEHLVADKVMVWVHLSPMWRNALEANQTDTARRFAEILLTPAQLKVYDKILRDPLAWLEKRSRTKPATRVQREVLVVAFARAARKNLDATDRLLRRVWKPLMPADDHAWARSQLALIAALNLDPRAHAWYVEAGRDAGLTTPLTEYNHAWRARAVLRQPNIDWRWLRQTILRMSAPQEAEPVWVYWYARALAAEGNPDAARERYARIANGHDYYGLLASEELGRAATLPPAPTPVTQEDVARARAHPGLQRALALFRAGWRTEAVPEWNFSLRGMTDTQLRAAAELARQEQVYDRVINTSLRTRVDADFAQRFIAPFAETLTKQAEDIGLDAAWVYGLIRQESRFILEARSAAGASGLMQLMPATASWTAKRIGMTDFSPSRITDFAVNTRLGTNYLNIVLQDLDGSQLLASAGYNAGPNRARLWRARLTHPVEGAIFAETIPFTETRLYVKHVMANATWYATRFTGQPQSLKARLGTVAPQTGQASLIP